MLITYNCSCYLSRSISGPDTIMRKGRLAVVFLYCVFLKIMKLHSQVKSLLETSIFTYYIEIGRNQWSTKLMWCAKVHKAKSF